MDGWEMWFPISHLAKFVGQISATSSFTRIVWVIYIYIYLPGNLHIQNQGMFEDACPFLKVGYVTVSSLECVYIHINI